MCLILFALDVHPRYDLVFLANRDEEHSRPSLPLLTWEEDTRIVGGKDLKEGGTWFAVAENGRLAAVTNVREPGLPTGSRSRGELVKDYLLSDESPGKYAERILMKGGQYGGFNLLAGDREKLLWISNRRAAITIVSPGIHGLSNAALDTPWPKVTGGKVALREALTVDGELETEPLFSILSDRSRPTDSDLPDTGVGLELERMLGSIFIEGKRYGTRSSTVVLREREGRTMVEERTWSSVGETGVVETGRKRLVLAPSE